jgi:hypothetical protein
MQKFSETPVFKNVLERAMLNADTPDINSGESMAKIPDNSPSEPQPNFKPTCINNINPGIYNRDLINPDIKPDYTPVYKPGYLSPAEFHKCCKQLKQWGVWNEGLVVKREGPALVKQAITETLTYLDKADSPRRYFWGILRRLQKQAS